MALPDALPENQNPAGRSSQPGSFGSFLIGFAAVD
jgi:hypothetical protein